MKLEGSFTLIYKKDSFMLLSDKKDIQVVQSADEPEFDGLLIVYNLLFGYSRLLYVTKGYVIIDRSNYL